MDEFLFIEVDEEITSIIERLHEISSRHIGLVVPRGATIMQSVVNLKLIHSEAKKNGKSVSVVTQDKIGRNLAAQIGLTVYDDTKQATASTMPVVPMPGTDDVIEIDMSGKGKAEDAEELPEGVKVHYYADNEDGLKAGDDGSTEKAEVEEEAKELINHEPAPVPESDDEPVRGEHKTKDHDKEEEPEAPPPVHHHGEPVSAHKSNIELNTKPLEEKKEMPKSLQAGAPIPPTAKAKKLRKWKIGIGIAVAVLAVIASWVLLSKATVDITVPSQVLNLEKEIKIDTTLVGSEPQNGKIKGNMVTVEDEMTKTYDATGEKITGQKAGGELTFYNGLMTPQTLTAGTTVTGGGKSFTLDSAITIPAAGIVEKGKIGGDITAKEVGAEYNLPASTTYSIAGNAQITATGATSGGTTEKITILSKSDLDNAKDRLSADAPSVLRDKLVDKVAGQYFIEKTITYEVTDFTSNKNVNDETKQFEVKAKVKASVMTFTQDDLRTTMQELAKADIPAGQSILINKDDAIEHTIVSNDVAKKEMVLKTKLSTHVGQAIDINSLRDKIKGKSVKDARQIINQTTGSMDSTISIKPNVGLLRLPWIKSNIKINLTYKSTTDGNTGN